MARNTRTERSFPTYLSRRGYLKAAGLALAGMSAAEGLCRRASADDTRQDVPWYLQGAIYEVSIDYFPRHSFDELRELLPHIESLGVKTIYLMPIFKKASPASGPYDVGDHYKLNEAYGTEEDLHRLIEAVHSHGLRILFDLVVSYSQEGSVICRHHSDWLLRDRQGRIVRTHPHPWGWAVNVAHPKAIGYFADVAAHYVCRFDIDGWRVDAPQRNYDPAVVAGEHLATGLLREVRRRIKQVKRDTILLAELSGPLPGGEPLFDEMCELSYDWSLFHQPVPQIEFPEEIRRARRAMRTEADRARLRRVARRFLLERYGVADFNGLCGKVPGRYRGFIQKVLDGQAASAELVEFIRRTPVRHGRARVRWIENHDSLVRVQCVFPRRHRALAVLLATLPGVPVIHAGQEIGERRAKKVVRWEKSDKSLLRFYQQLFTLRDQHRALIDGHIINAWHAGDPIVAYLRRSSENQIVVAINFGPQRARAAVQLSRPGRLDSLLGEQPVKVKVFASRQAELELPAESAQLWQYHDEEQ